MTERPGPPPRPSKGLAPGTILDDGRYRYEVLSVLGSGGFGVTYAALDLLLDRKVAIKEYFPSGWAIRNASRSDGRPGMIEPASDEEADTFAWGLRCFIDEAKTLAANDHRGLLNVHGYFESNGTAYMVMPLIQGETLWVQLRREKLTVAKAQSLLNDLLDALGYLHARQVLHRDVKPSNIVISKDDGRPVLIDFGAARQGIGEHSHSLTSLVSAPYSPREQYAQVLKQGAFTDIYAVSATIYVALFGPVLKSAIERSDAPELPELRAARIAGQVPAAFASALEKALAPNAADRFQTIGEFRDALARVRDQPPPQAKAVKRRWPARLGFAAVLVVVLGYMLLNDQHRLAWILGRADHYVQLLLGTDEPAPALAVPAPTPVAAPPPPPPPPKEPRPFQVKRLDQSDVMTPEVEALLSEANTHELRRVLEVTPDMAGSALIQAELDWLSARPRPILCAITVMSSTSLQDLQTRLAALRQTGGVSHIRLFQNNEKRYFVSLGVIDSAAAPVVLAGLRRQLAISNSSYCESMTSMTELSPRAVGFPHVVPFSPDTALCHLQIGSAKGREKVADFLRRMPERSAIRVFLGQDRAKAPIFAITYGFIDVLRYDGSSTEKHPFGGALVRLLPFLSEHKPYCSAIKRGTSETFLRETNWSSFAPPARARVRVTKEQPLRNAAGDLLSPRVTVLPGQPLLPLGSVRDGRRQVLTMRGHLGWVTDADLVPG